MFPIKVPQTHSLSIATFLLKESLISHLYGAAEQASFLPVPYLSVLQGTSSEGSFNKGAAKGTRKWHKQCFLNVVLAAAFKRQLT